MTPISVRRLKLCALVLVAAAAATPATPATPARAVDAPAPVGGSSPRVMVQSTADRVLAVLKSNAPADQKREKLEAIGMETFDFETMSKLVLAKQWKQFSPAQQQEFQAEFRKQLAITYGRRVDQYGNEQIEILGERTEPRGDVTVQSKVVGGEADGVKIDYRLRQRSDGSWLFIDVIVEGVSIASSYRSQFQELLSAGGADQLLAKLRQKNAAGEAAVPDPTRKTVEGGASDGAAQ